MLFTRHFDKSVSVYLFLEFEPELGKSEKFTNQGKKENKAFRIPFITKKQQKSRQALHRIFLKPECKVYRGAAILYCNASLSDVPSFSKMSQPPPFSAYSKFQCIMTFLIVIVLSIFVCSYCCKLFVINYFYLHSQVMHSVFDVLPCAHVIYRVLSHIIYVVKKERITSRTRFLVFSKFFFDFCLF